LGDLPPSLGPAKAGDVGEGGGTSIVNWPALLKRGAGAAAA